MSQVQIVPFTAGLSHSQLWVGSPAEVISGTNLQGRREMLISNVAGQTMFWGSGGVTMNNGTPLAVGDQISIPLTGSPATDVFIYGVGSGAGSCDIRVVEFA